MSEKLVMIGNGMAPRRMLELLFEAAPGQFDVTIFNAEPRVNYNRLMLSPVLSGEKTYEQIITHDDAWYVQHGVTLHKSAPVTLIDRVGKQVVSSNGIVAGYDRLVVATGSSPLIPTIPGLDQVDFLTNETIFDLTRKPGHLVIIGGGPIGLELAQAHRRLGCEVTILEGRKALAKDDPELAALVLKSLRADGIAIREGASVTAVERRGKTGVRVQVEIAGRTETIDGTHLLLAAGRAANVEGLALDKAGIAFDKTGIKVTAKLRTTNRRVYAIGDVISGGLQFTHVAGYHGGLVLRPLLFRLGAAENRSLIPWVTFTDPELAQVGLLEADALARHKGVRVLRWPYADNDRAQAEHKTGGFIKLVTTSRGKLLGVSIVGANAGEMINLYALAISKGMGVRDLAGFVPPYPTMSEIGKRAAITYFAGATRKPIVRRLVRLLRMFG